jgi:hypothetical protein
MSFKARAHFPSPMAGFFAVAAARQALALPSLLPPFLRLAVVSEIQ